MNIFLDIYFITFSMYPCYINILRVFNMVKRDTVIYTRHTEIKLRLILTPFIRKTINYKPHQFNISS